MDSQNMLLFHDLLDILTGFSKITWKHEDLLFERFLEGYLGFSTFLEVMEAQ